MVHLVTKASAVACLLFHVEHSPGQVWFWRWRITGSYPPPYLAWREGKADLPRLIFHPEIVGCHIEAEWRAAEDQEWSQATLRECAIGTASFRVRAENDFHAPMGFRAMAEVAGMVACYHFSPLELHAGIETTIKGRAEGPFPDNVLLTPGEFVSQDAMVRIENEAASLGSLIEVSAALPVVAQIPGSAERRYFARRHSEAVDPDLVKQATQASNG